MNRHFTFQLKDEVVRGMNREQYKAVMHYLRWLARYIHQSIDWDKYNQRLTDALSLGRHEVFVGDLLL